MSVPLLTILLAAANVGPLPESAGTVQGVVVNGTQGEKPIANADVLLQANRDGEFIPLARTKTDYYGKFTFDHVPVEPTTVYLPGADRDGVHYPGPRVRLDPHHVFEHVTIQVFDAVETPSPLLATRHTFDVDVEQQVMEITETLLVRNPSRTTFVGRPDGDRPPVTLQLSIPESFDRVTFGNEFHGRRFSIVDHRPVTDIPWPPGTRKLRFAYRIPLADVGGKFCRPLDLPCSAVQIHVRGTNAEQVTCNLPRPSAAGNQVIYASVGTQLPAGFVLKLQLGSPPFPWMQYARWGSGAVLVTLVLTTAVVVRRRNVSSEPHLEN